MTTRTVFIDGIALWTPQWPGWDSARLAFRDDNAVGSTAVARPAPAVMAANERRRASDSVLVALEVAAAAMAQSGLDASRVASVFTSAHGDLPITDALCRTLASDPLLLSPTRFHHSVHNAASGYWAIASGCHAHSTALAGFKHSFAIGLLEAAGQVALNDEPVLLVGFDTEACGPLASSNRSRGLLGVGLVLSSRRQATARWQMQWSVQASGDAPAVLRSKAAQALADNGVADALPLFEALAAGESRQLGLPVGGQSQLMLALMPLMPLEPPDTEPNLASSAVVSHHEKNSGSLP